MPPKTKSGEWQEPEGDTSRINRAAEAAVETVNAVQLQKINDKLDLVLERLARGDVSFATQDLRIAGIEKIVYGLCGLALTAIAVAVISLVVKGA